MDAKPGIDWRKPPEQVTALLRSLVETPGWRVVLAYCADEMQRLHTLSGHLAASDRVVLDAVSRQHALGELIDVVSHLAGQPNPWATTRAALLAQWMPPTPQAPESQPSGPETPALTPWAGSRRSSGGVV